MLINKQCELYLPVVVRATDPFTKYSQSLNQVLSSLDLDIIISFFGHGIELQLSKMCCVVACVLDIIMTLYPPYGE